MPEPLSSRSRPSEDTDLTVLDAASNYQHVATSEFVFEPGSNINNFTSLSPTTVEISDSDRASDFDSEEEFCLCGYGPCTLHNMPIPTVRVPPAVQGQVQQMDSADIVVNSSEDEKEEPRNGVQEGCAAVVRLAASESDPSVWYTKQIDVNRRYMDDPEDEVEVIDWSWPVGLTLITINGTYIPQDHEIDFDLSVMGIRLGHIEDVLEDYVEVQVRLTAAFGDLLFYEIDTELWVEIDLHTVLGGSHKGSIQVWTSRTEEEHLHEEEDETDGDGSRRSESGIVERNESGRQ